MVGFCHGKSENPNLKWMIGGYPCFRKPPYHLWFFNLIVSLVDVMVKFPAAKRGLGS